MRRGKSLTSQNLSKAHPCWHLSQKMLVRIFYIASLCLDQCYTRRNSPFISRIFVLTEIDGMPPWTAQKSSTLVPQYSLAVMHSNLWPGGHAFAMDRCVFILAPFNGHKKGFVFTNNSAWWKRSCCKNCCKDAWGFKAPILPTLPRKAYTTV